MADKPYAGSFGQSTQELEPLDPGLAARVKVGLTNSVENRSGDETIGISMIPFGELEAFSKWQTYWFVISMMTS